MAQPALAVQVRFHSRMPLDQILKVADERIGSFRALAGLEQKYYLQDPQTGEYMGFYLWKSQSDFEAYRDSELRASITAAYQVEGTPRIEVFRVIMQLRD